MLFSIQYFYKYIYIIHKTLLVQKSILLNNFKAYIKLIYFIFPVNDFVRTKIPFENRAKLAKCALSKAIFQLMATKKTNLCLAADLLKSEDILKVADICGPYICILKTHVDIIEDFDGNFISNLQILARKHNFMLLEDRKFADIGNTVALQYANGIYKIAEWADLVTAHSLSGRSIVQGLKDGLKTAPTKERAIFLLGEMSAAGNLIDEKCMENTTKIATEGADVDFVAGIVCQFVGCFAFPGLVQLTPGVKIDDESDQLGQQYQTPEFVVQEKGADVAVVGRGILQAKSMEKTAALYRDRLWSAYMDRIAQ